MYGTKNRTIAWLKELHQHTQATCAEALSFLWPDTALKRNWRVKIKYIENNGAISKKQNSS